MCVEEPVWRSNTFEMGERIGVVVWFFRGQVVESVNGLRNQALDGLLIRSIDGDLSTNGWGYPRRTGSYPHWGLLRAAGEAGPDRL